jgi:hypothetical protein
VYVGEGRYDESLLLLPAGLGIYGGYGAGWVRAPAATPTVVAGGSTAVSVVLGANVVLDGLEIRSAGAAGAGESSLGLLIAASDAVTVRRCRIVAGAGGAGGGGGGSFGIVLAESSVVVLADLAISTGASGAERVE